MGQKFALVIAAVFTLAVTGCKDDREVVAVAPGSWSWPTDVWQVSTLEAEGFKAEPINQFISNLRSGQHGLVDQFLLIRHGRIVVDEKFTWDYETIARKVQPDQKIGVNTRNPLYDYDNTDFHPYYGGTDLHTLQSITKSITSAVLGTVLDDGHIEGVDAPALAFFEDYQFDRSDPRKARMSLEDLLTMRSGIDWQTDGGYQDVNHSTVGLEDSEAWIQFVLDRPMDAEPGTVFEYNDGATVLLGKIVRAATGKRIDEWARERLFSPIGIENFFWKTTPDGEADSMGGLYLTAHDLARIGYLFLRHGVWRGERLLSENWVRQSVARHVRDTAPGDEQVSTGYGYQWWLPELTPAESMVYFAGGFGGQRLTIIPELDLVIVFLGWDIRSDYGAAERTFRREILPAALTNGD